MELRVRLQPRASRNELVGERDGVLRVRVTAPPIGGRANEALRKLISEHARVAPSKITLVRGERSREKLLRIEGLTEREGRRRLGLAPEPPSV